MRAIQERVADVTALSKSLSLGRQATISDRVGSKCGVWIGESLCMVLFGGEKVTERGGTWCCWVRLFPQLIVVLLIQFIYFSGCHNCRSFCARFNDVPSTSLVKLKNREEQIFEIVVVWFLIKTQTFDESISLSELVYYN